MITPKMSDNKASPDDGLEDELEESALRGDEVDDGAFVELAADAVQELPSPDEGEMSDQAIQGSVVKVFVVSQAGGIRPFKGPWSHFGWRNGVGIQRGAPLGC
jgi:hypothetical protein